MSDLLPEMEEKCKALELECMNHGIRIKRTSGYRSIPTQNALYAIGRTRPGSIVTKAKGGESPHNYRVAQDYVFVIGGKISWNGDWDLFGRCVEHVGLVWGGHFNGKFKDRPHCELPNWRQYKKK